MVFILFGRSIFLYFFPVFSHCFLILCNCHAFHFLCPLRNTENGLVICLQIFRPILFVRRLPVCPNLIFFILALRSGCINRTTRGRVQCSRRSSCCSLIRCRFHRSLLCSFLLFFFHFLYLLLYGINIFIKPGKQFAPFTVGHVTPVFVFFQFLCCNLTRFPKFLNEIRYSCIFIIGRTFPAGGSVIVCI